MFDRKLNQDRLVVGIGGNTGAGKTTVVNELRRYGAKVIDADKVTGALLHKNTAEYKKLVKVFGPEILTRTGQVDRQALADKAFCSAAALKKLNAVMHPSILKRIRADLDKYRKGLVIIDAPLLFSVGLDKEVDVAILVTAPERLKLKRLMDCGLDREAAKQRLKMQDPDAKVWRKADFVLENKGSLAELKRKSRALWNFFYSSRFQNLRAAR
ncbi:dephospho-CoA kinase [candidate division WOR-3 bacterium]|nr:dephospho-CoA kinase [candidate division WOR-3 bacterium]